MRNVPKRFDPINFLRLGARIYTSKIMIFYLVSLCSCTTYIYMPPYNSL